MFSERLQILPALDALGELNVVRSPQESTLCASISISIAEIEWYRKGLSMHHGVGAGENPWRSHGGRSLVRTQSKRVLQKLKLCCLNIIALVNIPASICGTTMDAYCNTFFITQKSRNNITCIYIVANAD